MTNRSLFFGSQKSREKGLVLFQWWRGVKLIVLDVKEKKYVATGADFTGGNILGRKVCVNTIITRKFEFLTAVVKSIQVACYITS
jgi:hypothetical protein